MSFWWEIKRRHIFEVSLAYMIVAWLLVKIFPKVFTALYLPDWVGIFMIAVLIVGFPFVILCTWIKAELAFTEAEKVPSVGDVKKTVKTIAVLPFVDLSPESDQAYFVDGLSEEILNSLTKILDLHVTARTSSFAFKGSDKSVQEIAGLLGVEHILEGSVRKADNALRITAQLVRAEDGFYLWSETYNRNLEDILAVQEDIAKAVANELRVTLGIDRSFRPLGGTDNLEAYELYLVARGQLSNRKMSISLETIDKAIAIAPEFALAWALKASTHIFLSLFLPAKRVPSEKDAGLGAAQRAIELEPNLGAGFYSLGAVRMGRGEFIEAALAYSKAIELTKPLKPISAELSVYYNDVGYFKRANKILEAARQDDPLNPITRGLYILNFGLLGDMQRAEEEYERLKALIGDHWFANSFIKMLRLGTEDVVSPDEIVFPDPIFDAARKHLASTEEGLAELRRLYANDDNLSSDNLYKIAVWAAYLGDPKFAMEAMEKGLSIQASGVFWFWLPLMRDVRQLPRFKELIKEIGLVDYWNEFGWPDICRPLDNGDFECD